MVVLITFLPTVHMFPFSSHPCGHLSLSLTIIILTYHDRWYLIVVSICIFLMISDVYIFSSVCWSSVRLPWKNVYLSPLLIFKQIFFFAIKLYEFLWMLNISCLSANGLQIFHSIGCALSFCWSFLCCTEAFKSDVLLLVYFLFICLLLYSKSLPRQYQLLKMFSSSSLTVSSITFKFLMYFKLIFMSDLKWGCNFTLLHMNIQFSQHHLSKILSFLIGSLVKY